MAKRGQGSSEFNMAEEIRILLDKDNTLTGRQIINALKEKFPKQAINENSCSVAVVNARRKMGISIIRRKRPAGGRKKAVRSWARRSIQTTTGAASSGAVLPNMELLVAAKQLLQRCEGDAAAAVKAIQQVAALQM